MIHYQPNLITTGIWDGHKIRANSGFYVDVLDPQKRMICVEDIAHALSMQPRFAGHLSRFYSVAQHCIHCAELATDELKLQALLHDASEAYLLDIPSPIKHKVIPQYKELETQMMNCIALVFDFPFNFWQDKKIKEIDEYMLRREWHELVLKEPVEVEMEIMYPAHAKETFLDMYYDLRKHKLAI